MTPAPVGTFASDTHMQQTKRHHFVPKAYLKAFCDGRGRLLVYRKDGPAEPLHVTPDATQFRRYYYSQQVPEGGQDNNTLEAFFSTIESDWPETVARLHRREDVNDRLESIFGFIALQRARVPASRDLAEASLARTVKDALKRAQAKGQLPPTPPGLESLVDDVQVSIDPQKSILAMVSVIQGMAPLFSSIGLVAVHNATSRPFLTSDNPVLWFDPLLPFAEQRPYTIDMNGGAILLVLPVSPTLAIVGSNEYAQTYGRHGLLHSDAPDEAWVEQINAQVCRFGYESVIAPARGQEDLIAAHAGVSPVHEAVSVPMAIGLATVHRQVFGTRSPKPKWRDE